MSEFLGVSSPKERRNVCVVEEEELLMSPTDLDARRDEGAIACRVAS